MDNDKINEVLDRYLELMEGNVINPKLSHLQSMIPKIKDFIENDRKEEAMRWLGFMQGVFWSLNIYGLDQLKDHNNYESSMSCNTKM